MAGGLRRFLPFASGAPAGVARPFTPSWEERDERAGKLSEDHPEAAAALGFYRGLLEIQRPLSEQRALGRWLDAAAAGAGEEGPVLRLKRLPVKKLRPRFLEFLEELVPVSTPVLEPLARRLVEGPELAVRALAGFLAGESLDDPAAELGCSGFQLEFFPRAFLQPVTEGLAALAFEEGLVADGAAPAGQEDGDPTAAAAATECPLCGHLPVAGRLADEPEVENRRRLVCSLCSTAWPFPRLTCPACGETEAERLGHHVAESWPHLRVEECESCSAYLKTADLREDGHAVAVVDDIASMELDVWADDRELRKIRPNVLGI